MTLTNLSKTQILSEKAVLNGLKAELDFFTKGGYWSKKEGAFRAARWISEHGGIDIVARINLNDSILSDQRNIDRWYLESPEYAAEQVRLTLIEKNDFIALQLWTKINNQKITDKKAEIARLAVVKEKQEIQRVTKVNRLQKIEDKETERITKPIPLLTTILPVGILAILLINSSRGKK